METMKPRRVAILVELPRDADDMPALRRCIKALLRAYGLRCVAIRPPIETETFKRLVIQTRQKPLKKAKAKAR